MGRLLKKSCAAVDGSFSLGRVSHTNLHCNHRENTHLLLTYSSHFDCNIIYSVFLSCTSEAQLQFFFFFLSSPNEFFIQCVTEEQRIQSQNTSFEIVYAKQRHFGIMYPKVLNATNCSNSMVPTKSQGDMFCDYVTMNETIHLVLQ